MLTTSYIPTRDELIGLIENTLPPPIIDHAAAGESLEAAFEYPDIGLYAFGDRLIMVAGLSLCALYVDLAASDRRIRSDHYVDFIRTILFQRGYDRGLACALFQRLGQLGGPVFSTLHGDDGPVTNFSALRRSNAANAARARMLYPLESHLHALISRVSFLQRFSFGTDAAVDFDGRRITMWPFLLWDGKLLRRVREPRERNAERLPDALEWVGSKEDDSEIRRLSFVEQQTIRRIAELVFHATPEKSIQISAPITESVLPLFADTHPQMNRLAGLVQQKANPETRAKLLAPFLSAERGRRVNPKEALAEVDNTVLMENAIIRQCVELDPIAVLKTYLQNEPGDTVECLTLLSRDEDYALKTDISIAARAADLRRAIEPLYPAESHLAAIDREIESYTALLAAKEVARLLGFRIVEQYAHESVDAYIVRVTAFAQYVCGKRHDPVKIANGLLECSKIAHDVLRFLIMFYSALKSYDPQYEDGLDPGKKELLQRESESIWGFTFSKAIKRFKTLRDDRAIVHAVRQHLGRPMWSDADVTRHVTALDEFREKWRNEYAHESGIPEDKDSTKLTSSFLDFLKWLRDPADSRSHRDRIYPAVLHLNVLTMNQSGITSVKYGLTEKAQDDMAEGDAIRLYTRQPLANFAGIFYGLPNQDKSQDDLWVDPVLVPTTVFPPR